MSGHRQPPIFLTRRAVPLPGWRSAFPAARIRGYPQQQETLAAPGNTLVWLHLDNQVRKPAGLVADVTRAAPQCPIIVLANVPSEAEGLTVLEAGASGYTNALAVPEVLRQIETVVGNGGLWVGPELLQRLIAGISRGGAPAQNLSPLDKLSPREREVALAVARGATNKEVARQLEITERTVKAHLGRTFELLGLRDRLQLALLINGLPSRQD
jgi:two-component system, NarL family, nitrate/nitrite response regulator NarL